MKRSIKHLPKNTQEELNTILELIKHDIPWCRMVVLYGSYARKNYVLWDERIEFGVNTAYQSDYDIMIVISNSSLKSTEDRIRTKITPKYHIHLHTVAMPLRSLLSSMRIVLTRNSTAVNTFLRTS